MGKRRTFSWLFFTDLLFNLVVGLVCLYFLALLLINPPTESKTIESKAEFLVLMDWPEKSNADLDLWVEMPDGAIVGYLDRQTSVVSLERDDQGLATDTHVNRNGVRVFNPINREIITVRGIIAGEWTFNVHYFASRPIPEDHVTEWKDTVEFTNPYRIPVEVQVQVIRLNPSYKVVSSKKILLTFQKEERTMARFIIDDEGKFVEHIAIPKQFVLNPNTNNVQSGVGMN